MKGMILAAGFGTRLRPVTYEMPKPMAPLCNRPLIGYAVEAMLQAGVREIVVNLHHLPEPLQRWLEAEYAGRTAFKFSFEPEILGTGGGIRNVRHHLESDEDFALMNGDTIQIPPLDALAQRRRASDTLAALLLRHPPAGDRFTPVFHEEGFVTGFRKGSGEALMFAGCHVISRRIFDVLPDRPFSGITEDVYIPETLRSSRALSAVVDDGVWFDIGTPQRFLMASESVLQLIVRGVVRAPHGSDTRGDSLVDDTAKVSGEMSRSTIWRHGRIEAGARVEQSSMWENVSVGQGASVTASIISHGVQIPAASNVENALVARRLENVDYDQNINVTDDVVWVPVDPSRISHVTLGAAR